MTRRWRDVVRDWVELELPHWVCKIRGHKKPYDRRFGGDLICPRCRSGMGKW